MLWQMIRRDCAAAFGKREARRARGQVQFGGGARGKGSRPNETIGVAAKPPKGPKQAPNVSGGFNGQAFQTAWGRGEDGCRPARNYLRQPVLERIYIKQRLYRRHRMRETPANMREKLFTMRMSDEESARLDAVARHYGLNAAGVIRMLVKREYDAQQALAGQEPGKKPATPKKPKK